MKQVAVRWLAAAALALPALSSCTAPGGPDSEPAVLLGSRDGGSGAPDVSVTVAAVCLPAVAEALPGRIVEAGEEGPAITTTERTVFVTDLYRRFKGLCGACHVDNGIGNFRVDIGTFPSVDQTKVLAAIMSDDPTKYMPPPASLGKPYTQRQPGDPVIELVNELRQWFAQKTPADVFRVSVQETTARESYALPEELALAQTNMGSCIPSRTLLATQKQEMDELDAMFAAATALPERLSQTDLTSLDNAVLASRGVVAFAPAYPLWSDDSGKMRAIRVPRGTSVKFDKATQRFSIPPNTRLYKTFLKKIVDRDGNTVWRKIETRIILARPDAAVEEGPVEVQALFGTYAWNEDETEAVLVADPLRNGEPFADRMFTYVADEPRYQKILDAKPANLNFELGLDKNKGVVRHYAIPGKQRCVECHMGSPSEDFVLGFTPLQVRRRPKGQAGVYEEVGPDELQQLERLIDYGVITGISSPSEIRGLEEAQGTRKPRNQYELTAQAYLLGNCAHCHNPRGFPSVKSPELVELLDLWPSDKGGVFQFPLERVSPLRRRGANQDVEIPYITPSLRDFPVSDQVELQAQRLWVPKWVDCLKGFFGMAFCDLFNIDDIRFISAPWRSLFYRNVETPYIYAEDYTVFPHMPRHSAGFDCRAPRIVGDWMVSIPALHKEEGALLENDVRTRPFDTAVQPYVEVMPGDPRYAQALEGVSERLYEYHHGKRYGYCPDQSDIVVREALTTTDPSKLTPPDVHQYKDDARKAITMPADGVPDRAHWVPSDLSETPGEWSPRRGDWQEVLVNPMPSTSTKSADVPTVLQGVRITPGMREYAVREIPFGLWKEKPGCDFADVDKVKDYTGSNRPKWMDPVKNKPSPDAPVYRITPGGAVFVNICVNCHGPQADSKGLLAEAISEMTGGEARVANFKDGLLGPAGDVGFNINRIFGPVAQKTSTAAMPLTAEDWAARYLSWMALGGTQRLLPPSLLKIVGASLVMGQSRGLGPAGSANMLELAQALCETPLGWGNHETVFRDFFPEDARIPWGGKGHGQLLDSVGDAEMWFRLCTVGNRPVVRVPRWNGMAWVLKWDGSFYFGEDYGRAPVMNERGRIDADGIHWDNLMPVCLPAEDLAPEIKADPLLTRDGKPIPTCPSILFERAPGNPTATRAMRVVNNGNNAKDYIGRLNWAAQGAANAGLAVLLYLEEVRKGTLAPKPGYDRCEDRKK